MNKKDMLIEVAYNLQSRVNELERKLIDMEEREEAYNAEMNAMRDWNKNLLADNERISSLLAEERGKRV